MQKKKLDLRKELKNPDFLLGFFFLAIFFVSSISYIKKGLWYEFLWLSNHWALINGIAFLARSKFMFSYISVLGIIPELFWAVDFGLMSFGQPFLGITDYWFDISYPGSLKIIALQHLINPFASIYGIMRFGFHRKAWIGATAHGLGIFLLSLIFFGRNDNVNCAWKSCIPSVSVPDFMWQSLFVAAMIIHIIAASYAIGYFTRKRKANQQ